MNIKKSFITIILFSFCIVSNAQTLGKYYVSPNGSDSNIGSINSPFKTIQKAFNEIISGDTIVLREGLYSEVSHQYGNCFLQNISGTDLNPIVIMAYPTETPIIDGSNFPVSSTSDPSLAVMIMKDVKHITIDGITIQNGPRTGIHFVGECENITIKNCVVNNCKGPGIGFGGFPPYFPCKNVVVKNNSVFNCAQLFREAISLRWVENFEVSYNTLSDIVKECIDAKSGCSNGKIFNNKITNGGDVGIYIDAGFSNTAVLKNIRVYNNLLINPQRTAIAVASEEGNEGCNIYIYNNLIYDFNKSQGAGIKVAKNSESGNDGYIHDVFICNNTVYGRAQQGLYVNLNSVENIVFRNNISMNNALQMALNTANGVDPSEIIIDHNLFCGPVSEVGTNAVIVSDSNKVFKNIAAGNFHLKMNSPAIDAGSAILVPLSDFDGVSRPQGNGFDIGCYEYSETNALTQAIKCGYQITDIDGNNYETIMIGNRCWTKSNMKTTRYANGEPIAKAMIYTHALRSNTTANFIMFGRLYTWFSAVNVPEESNVNPLRDNYGFVQGICPNGWHIPTIEDINSLIETMGIFKSEKFWLTPSDQVYTLDFNLLPTGYYSRTRDRVEGMYGITFIWSDKKVMSDYALACSTKYSHNILKTENLSTSDGVSVRCVRNYH